MAKKKAYVSVDRLADLLNLSKRRVQQLAAEGMPKLAAGKYEEEKCVRFYVRYLQAAVEQRGQVTGDGAMITGGAEKTRKMKADADLQEIILAERRQELVGVADVKKAFGDLIVTVKARILGTAAQITNEVIGVEQRTMIQAIVEKHLKDALKVLADDGSKYSLIRPS